MLRVSRLLGARFFLLGKHTSSAEHREVEVKIMKMINRSRGVEKRERGSLL